ncbi:hypothetical protein K438DRAFT_1764883 [Mycena galopus ATCC 62051]|nr:hypothetical protein K438DRAFT_1764883 [Mycena galopus ATCC 62051]
MKFSSREACLPVWHACCDAVEHAHPLSPTIPACLEPPRTPKTQAHCSTAARTPTHSHYCHFGVSQHSSTALPTRTPAELHPTLLTKRGVTETLSLVVDHLPPLPWSPSRTLPPAIDLSLKATQTYVVRGSGAIHTSLDNALADFNIAAAWGQATLCATDNPRIATHVAAVHTLEEARALVCLGNLGGQVLKEEYAYDSDNEYWHNS